METEQITWLEFSNGSKATLEQTVELEDRNKSKRARLRVRVRPVSRKIIHESKVILDRKIITEFTRPTSVTRKVEPVLMMDVKVSEDKYTSRLRESHLC